MKYLCVFLALGTLISATYAAPASSEIQQEQDDDSLNEDELLKQITDVAKSQEDDENDDNSLAEAQLWSSLLSLVGKPFLSALGGAVGKRMFRRRGRRRRGRYEAAEIQENPLIQALLENQLESITKEQQEEDDNGDLIAAIESLSEAAAQDDDNGSEDTLAEAELFKKFRKLFRKGKKYFGKGRKWKGGRRFLGRAFNRYRYGGRYYGCPNQYPQQYDDAKAQEDFEKKLKDVANEQGIDLDQNDDVMAAIESLPEKARAQFLFSVGLPLLGGLLGSAFKRG